MVTEFFYALDPVQAALAAALAITVAHFMMAEVEHAD